MTAENTLPGVKPKGSLRPPGGVPTRPATGAFCLSCSGTAWGFPGRARRALPDADRRFGFDPLHGFPNPSMRSAQGVLTVGHVGSARSLFGHDEPDPPGRRIVPHRPRRRSPPPAGFPKPPQCSPPGRLSLPPTVKTRRDNNLPTPPIDGVDNRPCSAVKAGE